ncbi:Gfo/Idh/MocA family protein [Novosphingobium sp.]|uniref:Gfo/Idh/MocA family protein n=1 Tax=Novosphingobium sp. TaxID=1874826 RepID=UPI002735DFAA|nr:Gfo/Idh/MocA family oxidoreductase [Novosphingobium sp.]MDP3908585.1 Gfo/Idh/MocA family oxidoreductase [Novosphingobium sp.]
MTVGGNINLGVIGLGRGLVLALPALAAHPEIRLVAAADPRDPARARFAAEFGARTYADWQDLLADPAIDAVYIAAPHQFHAAQAIAAAQAGKHVLVEKPMAISLDDCRAMARAAALAGTVLITGPSHSFDTPVRHAAARIAEGALGAPRLITALNYTDFLYRPRRPEELDPAQGGGVMLSQAAHQIDVVRLLAGSALRSVRAVTGDWDAARPSEGAYAALLDFANGCAATLTYSGYARFDSDELQGWTGEFGQPKDAAAHGNARRRIAALAPADEAAAKLSRAYGGADSSTPPPPIANEQFGLVLVSCERADLRIVPDGVWTYSDSARSFTALPPPPAAQYNAVAAFADACLGRGLPPQAGAWGIDTVKACLALARSGRERREITIEPEGQAA